MELIAVDKDGSVTVKMSAGEAKEIRNDINWFEPDRFSVPTIHLFRLLDLVYPSRMQAP